MDERFRYKVRKQIYQINFGLSCAPQFSVKMIFCSKILTMDSDRKPNFGCRELVLAAK